MSRTSSPAENSKQQAPVAAAVAVVVASSKPISPASQPELKPSTPTQPSNDVKMGRMQSSDLLRSFDELTLAPVVLNNMVLNNEQKLDELINQPPASPLVRQPNTVVTPGQTGSLNADALADETRVTQVFHHENQPVVGAPKNDTTVAIPNDAAENPGCLKKAANFFFAPLAAVARTAKKYPYSAAYLTLLTAGAVGEMLACYGQTGKTLEDACNTANANLNNPTLRGTLPFVTGTIGASVWAVVKLVDTQLCNEHYHGYRPVPVRVENPAVIAVSGPATPRGPGN